MLATDRWDADTAALIDVLASRYGIHPGAAGDRHVTAWWRWPARWLTDLAELLAHPRVLVLRRVGSGVSAGTDAALLQALGMLVLCLVLGNLLLGAVLEGPLQRWGVPGVTFGLLAATALSSLLSGAWRLVRRAPCWRRVWPPLAYLLGGAWLYFCAGASVMFLGVELVQPHVLERFLAQTRHEGTAGLPAASALVAQATRGPALAGVALGSTVWLAGLAWCVRGWAVFRIVLGAGRLAAWGATLLWLGVLAALGTLAAWLAA